jgi:hypothetical protein
MDTRPKHGQAPEITRDAHALKENRMDTPCPRQRIFDGEKARRDDGDFGADSSPAARDLGAQAFVPSFGRLSAGTRVMISW